MIKNAMRRRATVSMLAGLALAATLTGCGTDVGGMTCQEYNALSIPERIDIHTDLLREHDLDTTDVGNAEGVSRAVTSLCMSDSDAVLDDAADWDSATW